MDLSAKSVLFINLETEKAELKTFPDLNKYIGGMGLALKLYEQNIDQNPIVFAIGPLNGFFPYVSKTAVVFFDDNTVEDVYIGGGLSTRMKFSDLDAIVFTNRSKGGAVVDIHNDKVSFLPYDTNLSKLGLPGKRSVLKASGELLVDNYFTTKEDALYRRLLNKNLTGFSLTGTKVFNVKNFEKYETLYNTILTRNEELSVEKGFFPSCSGCPMGCEKSKHGETGGNVLVHSLVACAYAENIYSDVGTVFSCLNTLGYNYTHEDIENLPLLIKETLSKIT